MQGDARDWFFDSKVARSSYAAPCQSLGCELEQMGDMLTIELLFSVCSSG